MAFFSLLTGGCSEGLDAFRFFSKKQKQQCLKKHLNTSRPSEHLPVRGKNFETFWWDHRLQIYKISSWHSNGFPDGSNSGSRVYYTGEKPTVMLYTYINRHAGILDKNKTKHFLVHDRTGL